jgi:hypothetical protein
VILEVRIDKLEIFFKRLPSLTPPVLRTGDDG